MAAPIPNTTNLDVNAQLMLDAALAMNIDCQVISSLHRNYRKDWLQFTINDRCYYYYNGRLLASGNQRWYGVGQSINYRAGPLLAEKHLTKLHLQKLGFSVPEGMCFRRKDISKAYNAYSELQLPLCVKPVNGSLGKLVYNRIHDKKDFVQAVEKVAQHYRKILIEQSVEGCHFRFFYVRPNIAGVCQGFPLSVTGNGSSSIRELVEEKNQLRRQRNLSTHKPIAFTEEILFSMHTQGLTEETILPKGETVCLRNVSNHASGGETITYPLENVHPSYLAIVKQVCESFEGLHFSGVDLIIKDITQPAQSDNYWIIELNSTPGVPAFYYPWGGQPVDVQGKILTMLKTQPIT